MKPSLTFFADASVGHQKRSSGWGFWIKGDGRDSMHAGGPLKTWDPSTSVAELEAIANGLACAEAAEYFRASDTLIMLQTDNAEAIGCLRAKRATIIERAHANGMSVPERRRPLKPRQAKAVEHILAIVDRAGLEVVVRHVKGHTEGGGRNWVNRLCDRLAKNGRKVAERGARKRAETPKSDSDGPVLSAERDQVLP